MVFWDIHRVAGCLHRGQRMVQRGENTQIGRRAGGPGIGREVEQHGRDLAFGPFGPAQRHQFGDARCQLRRAFRIRDHVTGAVHAVAAGTAFGRNVGGAAAAAEGHRPDAAIEFRDRDHHRGLDR